MGSESDGATLPRITASLNVTLEDVVATSDTTLRALVSKRLVDLVSLNLVTPRSETDEGVLVRAVSLPLLQIIKLIADDPTQVMNINPFKWEEIVAATYEESKLFDRVTLTPRSGDHGRDIIVEKDGFGAVRILESVKRYAPGNPVPANDVRAMLGVLGGDPKASKGIVSTTSSFAPELLKDPAISAAVPTRLELVAGDELIRRLVAYTKA